MDSHKCTLDDNHNCEECGADWQECEDCYRLFQTTRGLNIHWMKVHSYVLRPVADSFDGTVADAKGLPDLPVT
jgi:hypothetical protein